MQVFDKCPYCKSDFLGFTYRDAKSWQAAEQERADCMDCKKSWIQPNGSGEKGKPPSEVMQKMTWFRYENGKWILHTVTGAKETIEDIKSSLESMNNLGWHSVFNIKIKDVPQHEESNAQEIKDGKSL